MADAVPPPVQRGQSGRGRERAEDTPIIRAFFAKAFFRITTTSGLIERLKSDTSLRHICGFTAIPSAATFSRRQDAFARHHIMEQTLYRMVRDYYDGLIVGRVSRDSMAVSSREKPVNKMKDVKPAKLRKRGRPKKGETRATKTQRRLIQQRSMSSGKALRELDTACIWGCKRNSQGNVQFWKGYKLHLDVTDMGIPVAAAATWGWSAAFAACAPMHPGLTSMTPK